MPSAAGTDGWGIACRVALWSNVLFGALTNVTVELATPAYVDPDGLTFCFTAPGTVLMPDVFAVTSLLEGGSPTALNETEKLAAPGPGSNLQTEPFFSAALTSWRLNPAELGTAADVLGTDPFYAQSYARQRYDDFASDAAGQSLAYVHQAAAAVPAAAGGGEAGGPYPRRSGNCVTLTGRWRRGTRYAVTLQIQNPSAAAAAAAMAAASASSAAAAPTGVWLAPLSYSTIDAQHLAFAVRGDKYGRVCPALDPARAALSATTNATPAPAAATCPAPAAVRSPRYPSACVACDAGGVAASGAACACLPAATPALAGSDGCGPPRGRTASAASPAALAAELCSDFSAERAALLSSAASDALGAALYPRLLLQRARSLLDAASLAANNASYIAAGLWVDERRTGAGGAPLAPPFSVPGRQHGGLRAGSCGSEGCRPGATFIDPSAGGGPRPILDRRYQATQNLHLIGYILSQLGYPCPALYDAAYPQRRSYGPYSEAVCAALPKN